MDKWQFGPLVVPVGQATETDTALPITVKSVLTDSEIEKMSRERSEARSRKDFKRADEIRKLLTSHGIIIEDKPDGTTRWKR